MELNDDQIGRAVDRLFDADRGSLLTEVVVAVRHRFGVQCDELLNDSTTVRFSGQYRRARKDRYRQVTSGRPGFTPRYRRETCRRFTVRWSVAEATIAYDQKSDGRYPLPTDDRSLTSQQVLDSDKRQPTIEKRFQQLKSVHEIAPVFLKNEGRIEAFFSVCVLVLLVQVLIDREIRRAMEREGIPELPLHPEKRVCRRPTTERVLHLFSLAERHLIHRGGRLLQVVDPPRTSGSNARNAPRAAGRRRCARGGGVDRRPPAR